MECAPNTTDVISLSLPGNHLYSPTGFGIPYQLANLTSLQTLNLANNNFDGCYLDVAFNSLKVLRLLDLSKTGLSIPNLSGLTNLRYLALSESDTGASIDFLRNLTKLEYLDLSRYTN